MKRTLFLAYAIVCYVMFLGVYAYACGFVGNFLVPKAIDGPASGPLWQALLVNLTLVGIFAIQHSVMARPAFKRWWTTIVAPPVERSTYVLLSNLLMILLFWQWRPMGGVVWQVDGEAGRVILYTLFAAGWLLVPLASFMTDHFDLFGVRQAWLHFRGRDCAPLRFDTRGLYRHVRHPLYVGWMLAFWAVPTMTVAHFVFAAATTLYMIIATLFEERDLVGLYGETYRDYQRRVPRFVPLGPARSTPRPVPAAVD